MLDWIESLTLGVVQGFTEFLPISSDGHLALTQNLFDAVRGVRSSGEEKLFFDVMLHLGTLAAILVHYRAAIRTGARGLGGSEAVAPEYRRSALVRTGLLALVATLPLIPDALYFKDMIDRAFQSLRAAGVGFLITAAVLGLTVRLRGGPKGPRETTFLDALIIGLAQMFAPLPGVSRSGTTIATALGLGLSRSWAVGFSLLMAVPAILGAAAFEIKDVDPNTLHPGYVARIVAAAAVAGLVGYAAIIWLVRIVRSGRLWYFSVYLVFLGVAVLVLAGAGTGGGASDGRRPEALDGPPRLESPGPGPGEGRVND